jgi:capsular polysaccharide biosynthesis protein
MNEKKNIVEYDEDEIDLRELILLLWKHKIFIICITLIASILTGLYSVFALTPVYDSKLNIIISMPQTYPTRYGDYNLPITTNQEYIKFIKNNYVLNNTIKDMGYDSQGINTEKLSEKITIGTINNSEIQNSFDVTVSAGSPQEAKKLAEVLYNNYIEYLDVMIEGKAIDFYYDKFEFNLKTLQDTLDTNQDLLKKNEELLSDTPQTINQADAAKNLEQQLNSNGMVVIENIINPAYAALETNIINIRQIIESTQYSMKLNNEYLKEFDQLKKGIAEYYETGDSGNLSLNTIDVVNTSVYLPVPPVAPSEKTSPKNAKNIAVGAVLGGMIGVMVVLLRNWLKNAKIKSL